jgi:hypothetical protein
LLLVAPIGCRIAAVDVDNPTKKTNLVPDLVLNLITDASPGSRVLANLKHAQGTLRTLPITFSEDEILNWPEMPDHSGRDRSLQH